MCILACGICSPSAERITLASDVYPSPPLSNSASEFNPTPRLTFLTIDKELEFIYLSIGRSGGVLGAYGLCWALPGSHVDSLARCFVCCSGLPLVENSQAMIYCGLGQFIINCGAARGVRLRRGVFSCILLFKKKKKKKKKERERKKVTTRVAARSSAYGGAGCSVGTCVRTSFLFGGFYRWLVIINLLRTAAYQTLSQQLSRVNRFTKRKFL